MHTVNFLVHLVEHHQVWVYVAIFVGLTFEGEFTLIATGILAHLGALNFLFALVFVLLGGLCKSLLGYYIGGIVHRRWHATRFLKYMEKRIFTVMPNFREKPFYSIFISKFIIGVNHFVIIFAGYQKVDFKKYLKTEAASTLIWAPGLMLLGYFFSYTAVGVSRELWRFLIIVLILTILFILIDKLLAWFYEIFEEFYDRK